MKSAVLMNFFIKEEKENDTISSFAGSGSNFVLILILILWDGFVVNAYTLHIRDELDDELGVLKMLLDSYSLQPQPVWLMVS